MISIRNRSDDRPAIRRVAASSRWRGEKDLTYISYNESAVNSKRRRDRQVTAEGNDLQI